MKAVLHVISDRSRRRLPLFEALVESAKGGADVVQIREKKAPASETYALVTALRQALTEQQIPSKIYVNDRTDIAICANLNGIHLAAKSLPIGVVNELRRQSAWPGKIGCSVHALDEAMSAQEAGADYVTFGHIFASESHPDLPPRGLHALRRMVESLSIPVVAIGGIDKTNVGSVLDTGCSGVAVIGAVLDTTDPCNATKGLKDAMDRSSAVPKVPF